MTTSTTVQVRSAVKLDSTSIKSITKFASSKLDTKVELNVIVDPQLIAGFKLNISGIEYDHSISGALNTLAQEL